jgi:hypothetical protein
VADLAALDQQIKLEEQKRITALEKAEAASLALTQIEKEAAEKIREYRDLVALKIAAGAKPEGRQVRSRCGGRCAKRRTSQQ